MSETPAERSADQARRLRERLIDEYGGVEVVEKTWRHPPHFYEQLVERFEAGYGGGAGAWVYDDEGRVLLVRDGGPAGWSDPGDKRREGESFEATAARAVREKTGVAMTVTDALELHLVDVYDGTDPERPALVEPIVVFAGRAESRNVTPGEGVEDAEWFSEHPPNTQYDRLDVRSIPFEP